MSEENLTPACQEIREHLAEILDGSARDALYDHLADCDGCRDARHDAERAAELAADSGIDYRPPADMVERVLAKAGVAPSSQAADTPALGTPVSSEAAFAPTEISRDFRSERDALPQPAAPQPSAEPTITKTQPSIGHEKADADAAPRTQPLPDLPPTHDDQKAGFASAEASTTPVTQPEQSEASPRAQVEPQAPAHTGDIPSSAAAKPRTEPMPAAAPRRAAPTGDAPDQKPKVVALSFWKKYRTPIVGGVVALSAAAALTLYVRSKQAPDSLSGGWSGKVAGVSRAAGGEGGLELCNSDGKSCQALAKDGKIPAGALLRTDAKTRAAIELGDGSKLVLDNSTELSLTAGEARKASLRWGGLVADVAHDEKHKARIDLPRGHVEVLGTKFALRAKKDWASVDVTRGAVKLVDSEERSVTVRAGEEGRVYAGVPPFASPASALGEAVAWSESALNEGNEEEVQVRGLGELKAKKPGSDKELKDAVTLTSHSVKVRISGGVARTEVDETFTNHEKDVLEGIFRFPLPPDAKLERLALEVDGQLKEGAFVDRDRAAAIWRGAIVNAAPQLRQQVRDEIVWVPGPWRDPALLEWQRGGRFELRIYPIPKQGSRRVVLAYTQQVKPSAGVRRYSYPLPHDPSATTKVASFNVDVEVRGQDKSFAVRSLGYGLNQSKLGDGEKLTLNAREFIPAGDLTIEYALPNRDSELSAWAYKPTAEEVKAMKRAGALKVSGTSTDEATADKSAEAAVDQADDSAAYVALALRPKLPRSGDKEKRVFALVVDASRSMFGESYRRASALATRMVRELDPNDEFTVLACDTTCRSLPSGVNSPGPQSALETKRFLEGITPEGASDLVATVQAARKATRTANTRSLRVVYIGDGTPTVGEIRPGYITKAVQELMPAEQGTITAMAVGADSDVESLGAMTRGGGGVVLPYVPGQNTAEAVYAALSATYNHTLRDVELTLPAGLTEVAPKKLDTVVAGSESIVVARLDRDNLDGTVVLRGKLGKESFEQRYPLKLHASSNRGNAFVPRLFASTRIADLEREPAAAAKKEAIRLSSAFDVASRFTSLLVLESQAMFQAFGLDNSRAAPEWTGEESSEEVTAEGELALADPATEDDAAGQGFGSGGRVAAKSSAPRKMAPGDPFGSDLGGLGSGSSGAAGPAATATPRPPAEAPPAPDMADRAEEKSRRPASQPAPGRWRGNRSMVPMRRIFERKGEIAIGQSVPKTASFSKISDAERELDQNPQNRGAVKKLFTLLALAGDVERARPLAERWSEKEPLDPEALTARADVAAQSGNREEAIRILGSVVDVRPDDVAAQKRLARLYRWAGQPEQGCRFSLAIAQIRSGDSSLMSEAIECARATGQSRLGDDMFNAADEKFRKVVDAKLSAKKSDDTKLSGDFKIEASWSGGADLDLAILHPDGHRVSWLGAPTRSVISATDVSSQTHEGLALRGAKPGEYAVQVVRSEPGSTPISGTLTITVAGSTRSVPFTLSGDRATLAIANIKMQSRLVPVSGGWGRIVSPWE